MNGCFPARPLQDPAQGREEEAEDQEVGRVQLDRKKVKQLSSGKVRIRGFKFKGRGMRLLQPLDGNRDAKP